MSKQALTLEEAFKRLEEIAEAMDQDIGIDDSIKLYGEAVKLINFADVRLNAAKQKVEKLASEKTKETEDGAV